MKCTVHPKYFKIKAFPDFFRPISDYIRHAFKKYLISFFRCKNLHFGKSPDFKALKSFVKELNIITLKTTVTRLLNVLWWIFKYFYYEPQIGASIFITQRLEILPRDKFHYWCDRWENNFYCLLWTYSGRIQITSHSKGSNFIQRI